MAVSTGPLPLLARCVDSDTHFPSAGRRQRSVGRDENVFLASTATSRGGRDMLNGYCQEMLSPTQSCCCPRIIGPFLPGALICSADRVELQGRAGDLGHAYVVSRQPRTLPGEDGGCSGNLSRTATGVFAALREGPPGMSVVACHAGHYWRHAERTFWAYLVSCVRACDRTAIPLSVETARPVSGS
jgi:hypothetical protein